MPKLRISDFDQTVTIYHTAKAQQQYKAATNTKEGLEKLVIHNNEEYFAVATFHKDTNYVLSYLLPLLRLTEEAIQKREIKTFEHHQLTKIYLIGCKYPLIIANPLTDNYDTHLEFIARFGKNRLINSIIKELPPCDEYYFYDDTEGCYKEAVTYLKNFYCYHVQGENPQFTIKKLKTPTPIEHLKNILKAYLAEQQEKQNAFDLVNSALNNLSLLVNTPASNIPSPKLGSEQNQAIKTLLDFLDFKPAVVTKNLELFYMSELGSKIKDWEEKTGILLSDFITTIQTQREEQAKFEEYDSSPFAQIFMRFHSFFSEASLLKKTHFCNCIL